MPLRLPCPFLSLLLILTGYSATLGLGLVCGFFPGFTLQDGCPSSGHLPRMGYVREAGVSLFRPSEEGPRGNEEGESGI